MRKLIKGINNKTRGKSSWILHITQARLDTKVAPEDKATKRIILDSIDTKLA